jgi:hypothetical protein
MRVGVAGQTKASTPVAPPASTSALAKIQPDGEGNWTILDNGQVRAIYPSHAIRFSVLWKAEVRDGESRPDNLTLDRAMEIFLADLRHRGIDFHIPSDLTFEGVLSAIAVIPLSQKSALTSLRKRKMHHLSALGGKILGDAPTP